MAQIKGNSNGWHGWKENIVFVRLLVCVCVVGERKEEEKGLGKAAQSAKKRSSGSGSRTGRRERVKTDQ